MNRSVRTILKVRYFGNGVNERRRQSAEGLLANPGSGKMQGQDGDDQAADDGRGVLALVACQPGEGAGTLARHDRGSGRRLGKWQDDGRRVAGQAAGLAFYRRRLV